LPQNFLPAPTGCPQAGHDCSIRAPHSSQKRASARFSVWQRGHLTSVGPPVRQE
jgi:hypothetical protein